MIDKIWENWCLFVKVKILRKSKWKYICSTRWCPPVLAQAQYYRRMKMPYYFIELCFGVKWPKRSCHGSIYILFWTTRVYNFLVIYFLRLWEHLGTLYMVVFSICPLYIWEYFVPTLYMDKRWYLFLKIRS